MYNLGLKVNYSLFKFIPKPIYWVFWSRSKPRESSLVLKRNVLIALGIVLTAHFGHLKRVNKCHWLKQLEHFFPFQLGSSTLTPSTSCTCNDRPRGHSEGWGSVNSVPLVSAVLLALWVTGMFFFFFFTHRKEGKGRNMFVYLDQS